MGSADGAFVGTELIYGDGDFARRWNLLIFAEGYLATDLGAGGTFDTHARSFASAIRAISPISEFPDAVNVYRVDVRSDEAGADDPTTCPLGTGASPRTYFDASFCNRNQRSFLTAEYDAALIMADARMPGWDGLLILVNSGVAGGSARGQVAVCSNGGMTDYLAHELGHVFGLQDEYVLWHDKFSGLEPDAANATLARTLADLDPLWASQVSPATPIPTGLDTACNGQRRHENPVVTDDTIGTFEGAMTVSCGVFRPSPRCKMRAIADPFCAVCAEAIREVLRQHA